MLPFLRTCAVNGRATLGSNAVGTEAFVSPLCSKLLRNHGSIKPIVSEQVSSKFFSHLSNSFLIRKDIVSPQNLSSRSIFITSLKHNENKEADLDAGEEVSKEDAEESQDKELSLKDNKPQYPADAPRHLNRDRTTPVPLEKSIRYLKSAAYKETYGDTPVWVLYRRNFPGQFAPKRTRKTCIRNGMMTTGNPCPICRDEYLVIHHCNVDLLKQFISPYNGEILSTEKTGVCRRQHEKLLIAIDRAKDYGTITFDVPFREYDYKEYEKIYNSY